MRPALSRRLAVTLLLASVGGRAVADDVTTVRYVTDRALVDRGLRRLGAGRGHLATGACDLVPGAREGAPLRLDRCTVPARADVPGALPTGRVLVFVHGFNTTFEAAVLLGGRLQRELDVGGGLVVFSWPSAGRWYAYTVDETTVDWSRRHLRDWLAALLASDGVSEVTVLAHSMGSRLATGAITDLLREGVDAHRLRRLVLAAPDVDAQLFVDDVAPRLQRAGIATTVYASARDRALGVSATVNGFQRLGDTRPRPVVAPSFETVDATGRCRGLVGHAYFADPEGALPDLRALLAAGGATCAERGQGSVPAGEAHCALSPRRVRRGGGVDP